MLTRKGLVSLILVIPLMNCEPKLENTWQTKPFINAYNEEQGVSLFIRGERLTGELEEVELNFSLIQDLISGGFKEIFTFTLDGKTSWGEDQIEVITPIGEAYVFDIYDGLLFNIDYESNEVARFIELLNNESLVIRSGPYQFTISTKGFLELYKANFPQRSS